MIARVSFREEVYYTANNFSSDLWKEIQRGKNPFGGPAAAGFTPIASSRRRRNEGQEGVQPETAAAPQA
jgi:hypothetical protein